MLTKRLAEDIVEQTMFRLARNLNVMDTNGMILASGERERVNRIHEGAAHVAKTGTPLWIDATNLRDWPGSKPGVNLPIHYQSRLVGVIGISGFEKELRDVATLVQLTTEMMVHQSLLTSESEWKRTAGELVFKEVVSGLPISGVTRDRMNMLSISLKGPFTIVIVHQNKTTGTPNHLADWLAETLAVRSVLAGADQGNTIPFLIWGLDREHVNKRVKWACEQQRGSILKIGIGKTVCGEEDIVLAYESARQAIQFGEAEVLISDFEKIEVQALMGAYQQALHRQYIERVLGSLNEQLLETLKTYLDHDQHAKKTSEELGIHRHTLSYRLKRISELTGLDPTRFNSAVQLYYAIVLKEGAQT
ncbi:sugar diacid recognition domain-containing protein [Sporosarcina jeotgali]|uniref:Sugar diacid recognition domain-containing protein n=1 Tax=Sporosarcina jeotgali TaxID=3020056 RepID=A0ABZ0KZB9_9BACL|nr:sugar diacid recognition domain-containing protein [Sporosarcina sp. B2O-1]WOV84259.1 sugar diacid recognition domain-containing protein [Sporosarcina sp. B2O-1]